MDEDQTTQPVESPKDIDGLLDASISAQVAVNDIDPSEDPKGFQAAKAVADQALADHDDAVMAALAARTAMFSVLTIQQARYLGINPDNFDNEQTLREAITKVAGDNAPSEEDQIAQAAEAEKVAAQKSDILDVINSNQGQAQ